MKKTLDILVLEDSLERIKWFRSTFGDCILTFTKDIDGMCDEMRTKAYDMIFLDRDLGYHRKKSGENVTKVMSQEKLAKDACIVIHSVNTLGRQAMKNHLDEYHNDVHLIDFHQLRKMKRTDFRT